MCPDASVASAGSPLTPPPFCPARVLLHPGTRSFRRRALPHHEHSGSGQAHWTGLGYHQANCSGSYEQGGGSDLKQVRFLAIDEVYLGKLHKFITLVINWESGQVLHVAKGRGENTLRPFFRRIRRAKAPIAAVAIDLSTAYAGAAIKNLPGALLVADRFHIIKLMNEKIDELRRALQREADILGRRVIKGTRYLLLRGRENLPPDRLPDFDRKH